MPTPPGNRGLRARRAALVPQNNAALVHGRRSTYVNHGCRCPACVQAQRTANADRGK